MSIKDELVALGEKIKEKYPGLLGEVLVNVGSSKQQVGYNSTEGIVYIYDRYTRSSLKYIDDHRQIELLQIAAKMGDLVELIKTQYESTKDARSSLEKARNLLK